MKHHNGIKLQFFAYNTEEEPADSVSKEGESEETPNYYLPHRINENEALAAPHQKTVYNHQKAPYISTNYTLHGLKLA